MEKTLEELILSLPQSYGERINIYQTTIGASITDIGWAVCYDNAADRTVRTGVHKDLRDALVEFFEKL